MRRTKLLLAAVSATLLLTTSMSHAATPANRSLFLTKWCQTATTAAISGEGATFANSAHLNAFIPAFEANCAKALGKVTYLSTGSGAGKAAACNRSRTWGGTDEPLDTAEYAAFTLDTGYPLYSCTGPGTQQSPVHHIPLALGGVVHGYKPLFCAGIANQGLRITSTMAGLIWSGVITRWDDALLRVNGVNAPLANCHKVIKLVARSDGSGTTYVYKDYLSKRNPQFHVYKQPAKNLDWPAGELAGRPILRASGNTGVASLIKVTDGAFGYVEFSTAKKVGIHWALAENAAQAFVAPSPATFSAAGSAISVPPATLTPGWDTVTITDGPTGYPISSLTYALVYNNLKMAHPWMTLPQAQTLVNYLASALDTTQGQARLVGAGYAKLPTHVQTVAQNGLKTLLYTP